MRGTKRCTARSQNVRNVTPPACLSARFEAGQLTAGTGGIGGGIGSQKPFFCPAARSSVSFSVEVILDLPSQRYLSPLLQQAPVLVAGSDMNVC